MSEPDYDAEMRLPAGVTCDVCQHAPRCFGFGYSTPGRTSCDFWPSRYRSVRRMPKEGDVEVVSLAEALGLPAEALDPAPPAPEERT